ncbi:uracil-DNA glycosylase [Candidatus Blochmanniella vafra str. BVAF]|uniref:Uracil-DNA glycosylase n=1 Tax=Blochmanniella vafra (strain BVAF) TaxID=859654 RepID=E8Q6F8_BLOVB|nr:uracil-DNA glycosylase [Candidatus Blochmannia vafer]ADV33927.1 uracil-DNA glycosylase [Candidatus Blochmannia vafer str. BVAF]
MNQRLTWKLLLSKETKLPYFKKIFNILNQKNKLGITIYPKSTDIFNAFRFTEFESVKVVILGQDPYHRPNQAHGLAFSVSPGITPPPSLKNIYKELSTDISDFITPKHGYLLSWAKEGVLLLNSILTVEQGKSCSHAYIGWEKFTDKIIHILNIYQKNIVFLLWGNYAKRKGKIINTQKHYILSAAHPSPLSAHYGFLGCKHFSKTNALLLKHNKNTINWKL